MSTLSRNSFTSQAGPSYARGNTPSSLHSSAASAAQLSSPPQQQPPAQPNKKRPRDSEPVRRSESEQSVAEKVKTQRRMSDLARAQLSLSASASGRSPRSTPPSGQSKIERSSREGDAVASGSSLGRHGSSEAKWPIAYWPKPKVGPAEARGEDGKKYLLNGLYWQPHPDVTASQRFALVGQRTLNKSLSQDELEKARLLPVPSYFGLEMLEEERDFTLAFDILRDHRDTPRPKFKAKPAPVDEVEEEKREEVVVEAEEPKREPELYRHITKNIFVGRRADKEDHPAVCSCVRPSDPTAPGCTDSCLNRQMQFTCDTKTCPCAEQCSNLPLYKLPGVPSTQLEVFWTGNRGFGLRTLVDIKEGEFVMEYCGEVISRQESYERVKSVYKGWKAYYFLDYDGMEVLDAGKKGNETRFINHSCGPNTHVVRWKFANTDEYQMGIFALRDIPKGTELSYDYGWQDFSALRAAAQQSDSNTETKSPEATAELKEDNDDAVRQRCFCGADVCSGFLGDRKKSTKRAPPPPSASAASHEMIKKSVSAASTSTSTSSTSSSKKSKAKGMITGKESTAKPKGKGKPIKFTVGAGAAREKAVTVEYKSKKVKVNTAEKTVVESLKRSRDTFEAKTADAESLKPKPANATTTTKPPKPTPTASPIKALPDAEPEADKEEDPNSKENHPSPQKPKRPSRKGIKLMKVKSGPGRPSKAYLAEKAAKAASAKAKRDARKERKAKGLPLGVPGRKKKKVE